MKALIAVDGSSGSQEAVRQAGQLLTPVQDTVALYYTPPTVSLRSSKETVKLAERAREALAEAVFADAQNLLPVGMPVDRIVGVQDPKHGIIAAAAEARAELIVVGARGLSRLERFVMGSVSGAVVHASTVPVLVARALPERLLPTWRVLLAYDGEASSQQAAEFLKRLSWPAGTTGHVATVVQTIFGAELPDWLLESATSPQAEALAENWVHEHKALKESRARSVLELEDQLAGPFHGKKPIVMEGDAAEHLLQTISDQKIDLLVMGARTHTAFSRLLLGSTSQKLLVHAPCSVLIVPQRAQPWPPDRTMPPGTTIRTGNVQESAESK